MADLQAHLDRLSLNPNTNANQNGNGGGNGGGDYHQGLAPPQQQQVRKQRSQRFTVATSSGSPLKTRPPMASSVPSLPYQPPPPPVQTQSILPVPDAYYSFNRVPPVDSFAANANDPQTEYYSSPAPQGHHQQYPSSLSSGGYSTTFGVQPYGGGGGSPASSYATSKGGGAGLRAGLPTEWMGRVGGGGGYDYERQQQGGYAVGGGRPAIDDEVIPTAIVIKNIPFHVPKETLSGIMEDLHLPPPFAFNYHFDNGQFRGLAFANFRTAQDAALTVSALNGFDLQGRKLRTEFKKVLKEGEKERIERDKALKRIRSQQQLSAEAADRPPVGSWNRREASAPGGYGGGGGGGEEQEDFGRLVQGQFSTAFAGRTYVPAGGGGEYGGGMGIPLMGGVGGGGGGFGGYSGSPPSDVGTSISSRMINTGSGSGSEAGVSRNELDLNDPQALEIYSRVLIFKDDSLRDELAFARSLSATQRRTVHLVAKKLGLEHRSVGDTEQRHVVVFKAGAGPVVTTPAKPLRHASSTLPRQPSLSFLSSNASSSTTSSPPSTFLSSPSPTSSSPSPAIPSPSLRARTQKKSMPDLRSQASSTNTIRRGGYATMGRAPAGRPSVQGLFGAFEDAGAGKEEEVGLGGAGGERSGRAVRQPRGPEEEGRGFGGV